MFCSIRPCRQLLDPRIKLKRASTSGCFIPTGPAGVSVSSERRLKFQRASRDVFLFLIFMFKNMYIVGGKNASRPYQVGHSKIANWFVIYCTSGGTLKGVVKLTFGADSSCWHSVTKARPSE